MRLLAEDSDSFLVRFYIVCWLASHELKCLRYHTHHIRINNWGVLYCDVCMVRAVVVYQDGYELGRPHNDLKIRAYEHMTQVYREDGVHEFRRLIQQAM